MFWGCLFVLQVVLAASGLTKRKIKKKKRKRERELSDSSRNQIVLGLDLVAGIPESDAFCA